MSAPRRTCGLVEKRVRGDWRNESIRFRVRMWTKTLLETQATARAGKPAGAVGSWDEGHLRFRSVEIATERNFPLAPRASLRKDGCEADVAARSASALDPYRVKALLSHLVKRVLVLGAR